MPEIGLATDDGALPIAKSVQPQLAVSDILATVVYWQDVIGFTGKWLWGDPPVHAGVNWGETQIQFTLNPELAAKGQGKTPGIGLLTTGLYESQSELVREKSAPTGQPR